MGALATKPEKRWVNRVAEWFAKSFPGTDVQVYNAGIGATGSKFGALRLRKHLLCYCPDIVIVEYSINDSENAIAGKTFEGILRQLLNDKNNPAVIVLAMMNAWGGNVEQKHLPLCRYYDIPMVSFRKLFEDKIKSGNLAPNLILADNVHPNDKGHKIASKLIIDVLEKADTFSTDKNQSCSEIPVPLYTDKYENVDFYEAEEINPSKDKGWVLDEHIESREQPWRLYGRPVFDKVWTAAEPKSELVFEYNGSYLALTYWKENSDMGSADLFIDDAKIATIDGWVAQTWGGYAKTEIYGTDLPAGKHSVNIVISSNNNKHSNGHRFDLLAFGNGK
jgi:lysophospholipase L1-like esterase